MTYLRSYAAVLVSTGPWRLALAVGLMVVGSLSEGVGIAVLIAVLSAAGLEVGGQGAVADLAGFIQSALAWVGLPPALFPLLMLFVVVTGARTQINRVQTLAIFGVEQRFVLKLRTRLYRAIVEADWLELARTRSSDLSGALIEQCGRLGNATFQILTLVADIVVSLILIALALALSVPTTILVLGAGIVLLLAYSRSVRLIHEEGVAYSAAMGDLHVASTEQVQSLKLVKAFGAEAATIAMFDRTARRLAELDRAMALRQSRTTAWFEIGSTLILAAMLYLSAEVLRLPAATLLTLMFVFFRLMPRFMSGHQNVRIFASSLPSFETVIDLIAQCEAVSEPTGPADAPARRLARELRLEGVGFAYGRTGAATVDGIDLVVPAGSVLALAGPSGSGKSTVVDLASGLLGGYRGRILVDGEPLGPDELRGWRAAIGYVGADTPLLHASLRANMLWACPGASDDDIADVLRIASIDGLVASWPRGVDTVLGDRGALLSQGERQRVGIARALLRRPYILVLDEATNGLDAETEIAVMAGLRAARPGLTILLVAHRLSTLHFADRIVVVENGRIVEAGTFRELTERPASRFRTLNEAQRLG